MSLWRFNLALLILALALGAALALLVSRGGDDRPGTTAAEQRDEQYADVSRAATAEVQAFLGIDHENVESQAETVLDGATGDFKQQYASELDSLKKSARAQRSTAVATVLEVGISDIDSSRALVLVAANTAVTSTSTDGKARSVPWRIRLDMVQEGGRWLTSGLEFVG